MRLNVHKEYVAETTHGGAQATRLTPYGALRRSVLTCLLWESAFYEDGVGIADRITALAMDEKVSIEQLAALAVEARHVQHLRHVPLLLLRVLVRRGQGNPIVSETIANVITRADELAELVALYRADPKNKRMLPAQLKKGLAKAFLKFDEYALAKYNRDAEIKLRDVLFLCHAKPDTAERALLWKRLVDGELTSPDTWEVALSAGADKKESFERLLGEGKLGYLALLRNLRNMVEAKVDRSLIRTALLERKGAGRVLPFRYVAAARHAPSLEADIDRALIASFEGVTKLPGKTVLVVDVSGSMCAPLSGKSDMNRLDTAAALAAVVSGFSEDPVIYATAGSDWKRVHDTRLLPSRKGMAMVELIKRALGQQGHGGIFLTQCMDQVAREQGTADRVIVITDEQDCDRSPLTAPAHANAFGTNNYIINISVEKNGVGYKPKWTHIDGWSENVIRWIAEREAQ